MEEFVMITYLTPRDARTERPLLRLVGPGAAVALALVGGGLASSPAHASPRVCGDRSEILQQLKMQNDEKPNAVGLSADGGVVEVLVSPQGGWTILVTYPKRPTCVVAVGEGWEALQKIGEQA
jgi:hypothetical protein